MAKACGYGFKGTKWKNWKHKDIIGGYKEQKGANCTIIIQQTLKSATFTYVTFFIFYDN